ncbi:uncharacterized protein LOC117167313 [Belonocnema kinseyi]|uniref:uncharacterized protein LOC117167313 n=1 Tax=Belonocnema kinseyi TaxID=2817044 RepID=UPI00143D8FCC|nr:uncharacterized protein LOC117167313 [Belonocnema kinseyi]
MPKSYRERASSTDSESEHAAFNNAFRTSDISTTTFNSTNFTSIDANLPTNTDESELRRLEANDSYLKNVSKNDTLSFYQDRSQSFILAAGTVKGAIANKSVESLGSTIIDGALDSDSSFYSPSSTLTNLHLLPNNHLDKRISSEEEFADCESSPEAEAKGTLNTCSTSYKSLRLSLSPLKKQCSENNNTIFPKTDQSADCQPSENSDSGFTSNEPFHLSSIYLNLPPHLQHLTTILEESTILCNTNPQISGPQLGPIVEKLRKSSMPHLPQTDLFNETIKTLAQILEMSSRQITVDQLALVLLHTLQTEYSYVEHSSVTDSFIDYVEFSISSDIDSNNTGMVVESIARQLRSIFQPEKRIESESEPEWHYSIRTPKTASKLDPQSEGKKKEYFPPISHVESNKENIYLKKISCREAVTGSPKKNKVRFSAEVCDFSSFNKYTGNPQKKKYAVTPRFIRNNDSYEPKNINATTDSQDDSFLYWERKILLEETSQKNLRRSLSMSNIFTQESTTSEVSKLIREIDLSSENQNIVQKKGRFAKSKAQERSKTYYKKRRRSLEKNANIPVHTNMPSTSGIQSKKNDYKNPPTQNKLQKGRKSFGVDSSHILPVSQARMLFSPAARRIREPQVRELNVPRIEISKASPQKCDPMQSLQLNKTKHKDSPRIPMQLNKTKQKDSPRKPWKP